MKRHASLRRNVKCIYENLKMKSYIFMRRNVDIPLHRCVHYFTKSGCNLWRLFLDFPRPVDRALQTEAGFDNLCTAGS